jgi:hypothetical protein
MTAGGYVLVAIAVVGLAGLGSRRPTPVVA